MVAANGQPRRDQKRTARVTPECCSGAAAAAAAAVGASGNNSWQLATRAGHSSTVDSRRRAPQAATAAAHFRQRRNRSAENLLAQCDCDRRFSEDQARQQRLLQETAMVHCDAPTIRADVEMSGAARARQ